MSRSMATGRDEREARQQFGVSVNQLVLERRMVPIVAIAHESRLTASGLLVLFALDDVLGVGKRVDVSDVVDIKVGADDDVDIIRLQAERGELFHDSGAK